MKNTIYIGADHRGFELKTKLIAWLQTNQYQVKDCGNFRLDLEDDYPIFAAEVAKKMSQNSDHRGIVICGSGIGVTIVANKFRGVRCGLAIDAQTVRHARSHDNINVLALAADRLDLAQAKLQVEAFLLTDFDKQSKYVRRQEQVAQIEEQRCK